MNYFAQDHQCAHPRFRCSNRADLRLDWVRQSVQPVLDLARLLSDGIEWTGVIGGICSSRTSKAILST